MLASERLAQLVRHGCLLASVEVGARGEHHLEGGLGVLKLAEHTAPEEDVVVAFHVGDDRFLFFPLGRSQLAASKYGGGEVSCECFAHASL